MKIRKSLFWKLVLSSIIVVVMAITILLTYTYVTNVRILKKHAIDGNLKDLNLISEKIDTYLETLELVSAFTYEKDLQLFLQRSEEETDITRMRRLGDFREFYYKRLVSLNFEGEIGDIYFIYPDGEVLHKGSGIYNSEFDFTKLDWYKETVNTSRTIVVDTHEQVYNQPDKYPEMAQLRSQHFISVARRVSHFGQNTLLGIFMMDIDINEFTKMLGPLLLSQESQVYFADASGRILYSGDVSEIGELLPTELVLKFHEQPEGHMSGQIDDEESVTTWLQSDKTGWYLVNINPLKLIISDIEIMKRNVVIMAVAAFFMTAFVSATYARKILRPVKTLTNAMKQVEKGVMNLEVPISSKDEIGYLTKSFNRMLGRIRELINDNYLSRLKEKDAQIESLQLQINPHFLYNTLESMNCIAMVREVDEISVISKALASMFRYSIRNAGARVYIKDEMNHIVNYMNIQKIRFGKKVTMEFNVPEALLNYLMLPLVLQPLVENAIKYTVEAKGLAVHICISIEKREGYLYFKVEDDGSGIAPEKLEQLNASLAAWEDYTSTGKNGHIGIMNVHSRIRLHYSESLGMSITSEPGCCTCISFSIPCENSAPNC